MTALKASDLGGGEDVAHTQEREFECRSGGLLDLFNNRFYSGTDKQFCAVSQHFEATSHAV
jgi:hypothetical protein